MLTVDPRTSMLVIIDFQTRLIPAIEGGASVVANARRLVDAARLVDAPALFTEQNPGASGGRSRNWRRTRRSWCRR